MDDRYKVVYLNIAGQMVALETTKIAAIVTKIEQWIHKLRRRYERRRNTD